MCNEPAGTWEHSATQPANAPEPARPPFDRTTVTLHWLSVLLVLSIVGTGLLYVEVQERSWAPSLLWAHRSFGLIVWIMTLVRLTWRLTGARFPGFPSSMTRLHRLAVRSSEYGLYALLLIQPLSGLAQTVLRGRPFELLAWTVPPVSGEHLGYALLFHGVHELGAWCLIGLVSLHAAAALFHHLIRHDDVLEAMAPILRRKRKQSVFCAKSRGVSV